MRVMTSLELLLRLAPVYGRRHAAVRHVATWSDGSTANRRHWGDMPTRLDRATQLRLL